MSAGDTLPIDQDEEESTHSFEVEIDGSSAPDGSYAVFRDMVDHRSDGVMSEPGRGAVFRCQPPGDDYTQAESVLEDSGKGVSVSHKEREVVVRLSSQHRSTTTAASTILRFRNILEIKCEYTFVFHNADDAWQAPWRDRVRTSWLPWMKDYTAHFCNGLLRPESRQIIAFDVSALTSTVNGLSGRYWEAYCLDLFFQKRFFSARGGIDSHPSARQLAESWADFVIQFNTNPQSWLSKLATSRDNFFIKTLYGKKMKLHIMCIEAKVPCAVTRAQKCPMCYEDSAKLPEDALLRDTKFHVVPEDIRVHIIDLRHAFAQKERDEAAIRLNEQSMLSTEQTLHDIKGDVLKLLQDMNSVKMAMKTIETKYERFDHALQTIERSTSDVERRVEDIEEKNVSGRIHRIEYDLKHVGALVARLSTESDFGEMAKRKR